MKISIISPTLAGGGAEKVAVNLANYYASIGHEVDLVLFKMVGKYIELVNDDVNLVDFNVSRNRYVVLKLRRYLKANANSLILSVIRDSNIWLGLASRGIAIKSLTYREASTLDAVKNIQTLKRVVYKAFMQYSYSKADHIIANSHDTKQDLVDANIITIEKATAIVNPVLPLGYKELLEKKCSHRWLNDNNLKVIISVGRLHELKNYSFLIECFADVVQSHSDARLVIVGEGDQKEKLQKQIDTLEMNNYIEIEEFQSNIFPYYQQATIFALASKWEGFGNVIVEALSAGTPVVSTNCPGGPKMILENGRYGTLVELGDKQGYVDALCHELKSVKRTYRNKERIDYAQKFSVECVGDKYFEVMKSKIKII